MMKRSLYLFAIVTVVMFCSCKNPNDDSKKDTTESAVPLELNDSTAGKAGDNKALEQLKTVTSDSTEKE